MRLFPRRRKKILTGNIIKGESGRYIAYFNEIPELTAEADSEDEVKERLIRGLIKLLSKHREKAGQQEEFKNRKPIKQFELTAAF